MHGKQRPTWVIKLTRRPVFELWPCTSGAKALKFWPCVPLCSQGPVVSCCMPSDLGMSEDEISVSHWF